MEIIVIWFSITCLNTKRLVGPSEIYLHSDLAYRDVLPDPDSVGK